MPSPRRLGPAGGAALLLALVGLPAAALWSARVLADPPRTVLHEHVPDPREDEELSIVSRDESEEPAAIVYDGELLPPPPGGPAGTNEHAIVSSRSSTSQRPSFRPDRQTDLDGQLHYQSSFTPSVAPFKRTTALNAVEDHGGVPVLVLHEGRRRVEPIVGTDAPRDVPRDRFWASVVLDFRGGREAPFPSVAAEMRVLTLRTEPADLDLGLERDDADNLTAILRSVPATGLPAEVRVTALVDAPRAYFATPIPEVARDALASEIPADALSPALRASALSFAFGEVREGNLGLRPSDTLRTVLERMTEHFRSFEESEDYPPPTEGIYLDLARAMKGVCRHRAYAFVITGLALGIPTRWVQNEAHAFVEVLLPGVGWMRIDLGGAAAGLEGNDPERPVYRPREPDPLPQPEAYRRSYSQLQGPGVQNVDGFRVDNESQRASSRESREASEDAAGEPTSSEPERSAIAELFDPEPEPARPPQRPLRLQLTSEEFAPYRGQAFGIEGVAIDPEGVGVEGLRVEVYLREPRREQLIGVTVTGSEGRFLVNAEIPPEQEVGDYYLVVRTPGDERFYAATAQ